jgi:hypothetical protein
MQVSEDEFLQQILEVAVLYQWRCHHQRPARTKHGWRSAVQGHPGWVDLVLCRPPRLIMAELKVRNRRPTTDQRIWLALLAQVPGVEVYCWWPKDLEEIVKILRREATR